MANYTVALTLDNGRVVMYGLSSDTKQTTFPAGSITYETDTNNEFIFNGSTWTQTSTGGAGHVIADSMVALSGAQSESVAISSTSAQSSAITTPSVTIYSTVDCFFRQGTNPTALSDGTDDFIPSGNKLRISKITSGNKLAFKTVSAGGIVYITPGG